MSLLEFRHVSKDFPGVRALVDVSLAVEAGTVHALLGENGAGKSTLLKALSGAQRPTSGEIRIDGRACDLRTPAQAIASGVAVIYQELHLVPELSVAENVLLGNCPRRLRFLVDRRRMNEFATRALAELGEQIDPREKLGRLSIGRRQMVEIAKALSRGARVIAFDEPTSSLSSRETDRLFSVIASLRERGCAILYVSHRLDEVFRVCDAATVLRDGRVAARFPTLSGVDADDLVRAMVGRNIHDVFGYAPRDAGSAAFEMRDLIGPGLTAPATITIRSGEIVGLFGLVGAGRTELLKLAYGATRPSTGVIRVAGRPVRIRAPRDAVAAGLLLCPEDRKLEGIIPVRSVLENINVSARRRHARLRSFVNERWERQNAARHIERLAIRTPNAKRPIRELSGGNQQKAIFARWLSMNVRALLLDEPTRGVDVGAKSEIYAIMFELARAGVGILMASSELPEVLGVCDRVAVMREGRIVGEFTRGDATEQCVLQMALPAGSNEARCA